MKVPANLATGGTIFRTLKQGPLRVTVIGGGNWGTAIAKVVAENAAESYIFHTEVRMWILEEFLAGQSLIEIINNEHNNKKYLPGVTLPTNLVAYGSLLEACQGANLLVFVTPHQYLESVCYQLKGKLGPECQAISLIKGCLIKNDRPYLCSEVINSTLGIDCCVLSGANVAKDVAAMQFSETTIGYSDRLSVAVWQQLFDRPYFKVNCVPDVCGVEICGAIKNVIAIAAGFCDGLGYGTNTKAALIRIGVQELRFFASLFFEGIVEETFSDSAGYADVITTCFGGRNVRCAKEFIVRKSESSWETIEKDLLNGQKLQGHLACKEVYGIINKHSLLDKFPLFVATYLIAFEGATPESLLLPFQHETPRGIQTIEECHPRILPLGMMGMKDLIATNSFRSARLAETSSNLTLL